jgi:hypothetical protein
MKFVPVARRRVVHDDVYDDRGNRYRPPAPQTMNPFLPPLLDQAAQMQ